MSKGRFKPRVVEGVEIACVAFITPDGRDQFTAAAHTESAALAAAGAHMWATGLFKDGVELSQVATFWGTREWCKWWLDNCSAPEVVNAPFLQLRSSDGSFVSVSCTAEEYPELLARIEQQRLGEAVRPGLAPANGRKRL